MSTTSFSGPVVSAGGFTGDVLGPAVTTTAGGGITSGATIATEVTKVGKIINTQIFIDIAALSSSTTDLDIIGLGTDPAYLMAVSNAESGQIFALTMTCLEAPTTGVTSIDLYAATEATGAFDTGIATLVETALVTASAAWTLNKVQTATGWPVDAAYLYLVNGAAGTIGTYAAGQFMIEMWGYEA